MRDIVGAMRDGLVYAINYNEARLGRNGKPGFTVIDESIAALVFYTCTLAYLLEQHLRRA